MSMRAQIRPAVQYLTIAIALSLALYYLPNYFFLEKMTADNSAAVLNWIGIPAQSWVRDGRAFVNEFEIERMCTGVQVVAVFTGILVPFPQVPWKRKIAAISIVAVSVYLANIGRIALEVVLLYRGILPWSLAHYPTGLILGVFSVAFLVLVLDLFIPQIGDNAFKIMESLLQKRKPSATPA
jgi:exosortase/archaeosortase family protein